MAVSIWDDPFGEEREDPGKPVIITPGLNQQTVDIRLIRERHKKLLPDFELLRQTACEIIQRYNPADLLLSERVAYVDVHFRIPDAPHLLQRFGFHMSDFAVMAPTEKNSPSRFLDLIAPPIEVSKATDQKNLSNLLLLESIALEQIPEKVRIIYPSLMKFLSFWVKEVEGPINSVCYSERPANSSYQAVNTSQLRQ